MARCVDGSQLLLYPASAGPPLSLLLTVQQLVTATLCAAGATRWAGKAPRGKLARRANKILKAKGLTDADEESK